MPQRRAPESNGKIALVTGASAGIGVEIARGLVTQGFETILAVRSADRGEAAALDIASSTGAPKPRVMFVDFASMLSIRMFAADFQGRFDKLDVLVNNAGTWSSTRRESADKIELVWATNQLGYFLTTELLRPVLRSASRGRIVNVASDMARDLDLTDVEFKRRNYSGLSAYAQSKQANRMWTRALARRLNRTRVTANSMHPGGVATGLFGKGGGLLAKAAGAVASMVGRTPADGADTAVWLATAPELDGRTGGFYVDRKERTCRFSNVAEEDKLFELCASMTRDRA
ncbi:MAG: SDR family NAD(P)-dependent oxidoreductase [Vicinamibacteria bacterium]